MPPRTIPSWLHYLVKVIRAAFSRSLARAQDTIFILLILGGVGGAVSLIAPSTVVAVDVTSWRAAAVVLVVIVAIRLLQAPYWIYKVDRETIGNLEAKLERLTGTEIIFDPTSPRYVTKNETGAFVHVLTIGLKNRTDARLDECQLQLRVSNRGTNLPPHEARFPICAPFSLRPDEKRFVTLLEWALRTVSPTIYIQWFYQENGGPWKEVPNKLDLPASADHEIIVEALSSSTRLETCKLSVRFDKAENTWNVERVI
jgi:hypothetical protein